MVSNLSFEAAKLKTLRFPVAPLSLKFWSSSKVNFGAAKEPSIHEDKGTTISRSALNETALTSLGYKFRILKKTIGDSFAAILKTSVGLIFGLGEYATCHLTAANLSAAPASVDFAS
ncbi:unannotated protein [freshwater metagenome]|uniref:Unannotated protein n=1 Tax=freshwater metagenome TaxID=449393 RepID=A0A6J7QTM7_9ZZZZ